LKLTGTVVAAHGRQYRIELAAGETLLCVPRGKKSELVCGDRVIVERTSASQGVVASIEPRQTLLYRSDHCKQKLIAANVTQVVVVVATEPAFSDELITRCIVAAESQKIGILIVLNKCDLRERLSTASAALAPYEKLGYRVIPLCALRDSAPLRPYLADHVSVLIGQSGMGKSTLINALTGASVYAADQLFATLDPALKRLPLGPDAVVILADTVGFVRDLPHELVAAG